MAKSQKKRLRDDKLKGLFSKLSQSYFSFREIHNAPISRFCKGQDKDNHRSAETWMLIQRIGPLDLAKLKLNDGEERTFYDMFIPDNEGKTYKGEW